MKKIIFNISFILFLSACSETPNAEHEETKSVVHSKSLVLNKSKAEKLSLLPLTCIDQEFPNKPGIVLDDESDLALPKVLHPAFYGCFDWHSSVHGHWSLVLLLKKYPTISNAKKLKMVLREHLSSENIKQELDYFKSKTNASFERTYGWAWLLKLDLELLTWNDPLGSELHENLRPLAEFIVQNYTEFLPKLNYPLRVGTHNNTAFGLRFAYEYALEMNHSELKRVIRSRAKSFYMQDVDCPMKWEPSGTDFLSPCLEEANLMKLILPKKEFKKWLRKFLPQLFDSNFKLLPGEVSDRTDGHLVHLDGLNFSRAWCLYHLAADKELKHLKVIADEHVSYSFSNLIDDDYMGGHWLGSFALLAITSNIHE